ncbi:MAG TPA: CRISPR-associated endonuclease Cas2 [Rhodospirillales bacterium]|nr:CRISPR-associated endonuclease Cas2 [Rhodospirillales bacterium]
MLSGYRLMWLLVMFDLPVGTKKERKAATDFRKFLLDQGFEMAQFSVYLRFCGSKEQAETYVRRIRKAVPARGQVSVLRFTDKQYESMWCFVGGTGQRPKSPGQYALF